MTPPRRRRPAPGRPNLVLPAILLLAANAAVGRARGQSAPGTDAPGTDAPAGYPDPRSAGLTAAVPECGFVAVTSGRCDFKRLDSGRDRMQLRKPMANIIDVLNAGVTSVPFAYNGLRQVLKNTFAADPAKPGAYAEPPLVTVSVKPAAGGPAVSVTRSLASNIQKSVQADSKADKYKFQLKRERGGGNFAGLPLGKCEVVIRGPCTCPAPPPPPPPPPAACTFSDTACAAGSTCPGGTAVSAECADRSGFDENPCACTALQQLAALSTANLATAAPWNDLANAAYCTVGDGDYYSYDGDYDDMDLDVRCTLVDGVNLPDLVNTGFDNQDLTGALPAGLGDLGPALKTLSLGENQISELPTELGTLTGLTKLELGSNALTSVPTELGALTGLTTLYLGFNAITALPTELGALTALLRLFLNSNSLASVPTELGALAGLTQLLLSNNQLTGVPADFRTFNPSICNLSGNPSFSCANVGAETSCCTESNCGDTQDVLTCYAPPPTCSYTDTTCAAGSTCPGGTVVSAACADRTAFAESPCACTALEQLAALSAANLAPGAPWNDLANAAYCTVADGYYYSYDGDYDDMDLDVRCTLVDGVNLPDLVNTGSSNQDLTGALPAGLGDLGPAVKILGLGGNQISELPTELGTLTGLTFLDLGSNVLTAVPPEIAALTGLTYLLLAANALTAVPTELAALTGLKFLSLDGNAVTSVPTEIGALTALTFLDFSNNDITSVPTQLGALTSLSNLQLPNNALTSLPSEIVAAMTGLARLELNNNQLTGVPAEFRTVDPSFGCYLSGNPSFSCANVGAGTECCTSENCGNVGTCYSG